MGPCPERLTSALHLWNGKPAGLDEVKNIVTAGLADCDEKQLAIFGRYAVEPYLAPILRYEEMDSVVVVARKGEEVIYWEHVEEGFNVSPTDEDGRILEHLCNQDELRHALNAWIDGRERSTKLGPAVPVEQQPRAPSKLRQRVLKW